jgi:hypothetical protein
LPAAGVMASRGSGTKEALLGEESDNLSESSGDA